MKLCFFGAAPDTTNLGVSALSSATLSQLHAQDPSAEFVVFDFSKGVRKTTTRIGNREIQYVRCGCYLSRRFYQHESLWNTLWSARLGGLNNPAAQALLQSRAVLDITGGDSFTDLYGPLRFKFSVTPKLVALKLRRPLILLPQTYGPFKSKKMEKVASDIVKASLMAWARDENSFEILKQLLGSSFDATKHRLGIDVAFGLEKTEPASLPETYRRWIEKRDREVVGINISGLIYNDPLMAKNKYQSKAEYRTVIERLISKLLSSSDARICLMPHVLAPLGNFESDLEACQAAAASVQSQAKDRLFILPLDYNASEMKWIISKTDWFCGTRMHATIAGLSSEVPTATIAYSDKARGVFASCGQQDHVSDLRTMETDEIVESMIRSFQKRSEAKTQLELRLPSIKEMLGIQFKEIMNSCR